MNFSPELLKQLLATFQEELKEGANTIINGLVDLEKNHSDPQKRAIDIESVFRTAHNLKGASRGLGITSIGDIAHSIENIFSGIMSSQRPVSKETIDVCLEAVDKMQAALVSFAEHSPLNFDIEDLKKRLIINTDKEEVASPAPALNDKPEISRHTQVKEAPEKLFGSDTIRVPLKIIDKLSELSEEVQASKIELDDHCHHAKILSKTIREFGDAWKDISNEMHAIGKIDDHSRLQKTLTNANDDLINIMSSVNKLSNDIASQANDYARLSRSIHDEVGLLRLVPANNFLALLPRNVRELATELGKQADLEIHGGDVYIDKYVLEGLKDPINHILRNAIDHGLESTDARLEKGKNPTGTIKINVKDVGQKIYFEISDDGDGLDYDAIKRKIRTAADDAPENIHELTQQQIEDFIFHPGFSTRSTVSSISGRGVGLDVVRKNVQALKGSVVIDSQPGKGTTFTICVPLSLSSERGLIIKCDDERFVIPTACIDRVMTLSQEDVIAIEGGQAILVDEHPVVIKSLTTVLGNNQQTHNEISITAVILKVGSLVVALAVDSILGEREIVIKPIQEPLSSIDCVSGATLLDRNKIAIVLNPDELIKMSLNTISHFVKSESGDQQARVQAMRILVVDDSITTRILEKNVLESKGYLVTTAVNGQEAWDILQKQPFSLVITDLNMPIMNGFELTAKIKTNDKFANIPVIIVSSLGSDAEKAKGLEAGADAYIVKNEFESGMLLQIIEKLVY